MDLAGAAMWGGQMQGKQRGRMGPYGHYLDWEAAAAANGMMGGGGGGPQMQMDLLAAAQVKQQAGAQAPPPPGMVAVRHVVPMTTYVETISYVPEGQQAGNSAAAAAYGQGGASAAGLLGPGSGSYPMWAGAGGFPGPNTQLTQSAFAQAAAEPLLQQQHQQQQQQHQHQQQQRAKQLVGAACSSAKRLEPLVEPPPLFFLRPPCSFLPLRSRQSCSGWCRNRTRASASVRMTWPRSRARTFLCRAGTTGRSKQPSVLVEWEGLFAPVAP